MSSIVGYPRRRSLNGSRFIGHSCLRILNLSSHLPLHLAYGGRLCLPCITLPPGRQSRFAWFRDWRRYWINSKLPWLVSSPFSWKMLASQGRSLLKRLRISTHRITSSAAAMQFHCFLSMSSLAAWLPRLILLLTKPMKASGTSSSTTSLLFMSSPAIVFPSYPPIAMKTTSYWPIHLPSH